jgi:DNA invertase Pin-like site-specific DNA recombinase
MLIPSSSAASPLVLPASTTAKTCSALARAVGMPPRYLPSALALARSVRHLCEIVDRLQAKGVALRILNMNLDTNDATGKLMLQIIGSIAEFERNIMLSRQLEGIAKAKAEGKYRGGIPTARAEAEQLFALVDAGKTRAEAAEALGISIRSVFRILRTRKDAEKAAVAPQVTRVRTRPQVSA